LHSQRAYCRAVSTLTLDMDLFEMILGGQNLWQAVEKQPAEPN